MVKPLRKSKRLALFGLILLASCLSVTITYELVHPWQTDLHNDIPRYYRAYRPDQPFSLHPFYRPHSKEEVKTAQAKPIFMTAVNLWGNLTKWNPRKTFFSLEPTQPSHYR